MTLLKLPLLTAMVVAVFVAWLAAGCAGGSPGPGDFVRPTVPPPAAAVPTPAIADPAPSRNLGSASAVPTTVSEICPEHGYCGRLEPGGRLTAAAWLDDDRMYLADYEGKIRLLDVSDGTIETVLTGLTVPQGLTVLDGRLYVSDLGNLCDVLDEMLGPHGPERRWCYADSLTTGSDGWYEAHQRVNAQILSYQIDQDGGLDRRQVAVDQIAAIHLEHSIHGLVNDGEWIYVSIGSPYSTPDPDIKYYLDTDPIVAASGRRMDLLGTIARFRPGDTDVEIWATGFRNIYGISIAPDGTIYGADNDTQDGLADCCQLEELNAIVAGGFYGFPFYGTYAAPPEANVIEPVAVLEGTVSTFAHANQDGVYVAYLILDGSSDGFVIDRFGYDVWTPERVFSAEGHTTAILERNGLLYLASFDGNIHVINPDAAPVRILTAFHNDDYVDRVINAGNPPIISEGYEVYIDGGRLIYDKTRCGPVDRERFFLHIIPVNNDDLPESRKKWNNENLDFNFDAYGWRSGSRCRAVRELPEYDISIIRTGQVVRREEGHRRTWEAEYHFGR